MPLRGLGVPAELRPRQQVGEDRGQVLGRPDEPGRQVQRTGGRVDECVGVRGRHPGHPSTAVDHGGGQVGGGEHRRGRDEELVHRPLGGQVHLHREDVDRAPGQAGGEDREPTGHVVNGGPYGPQLHRPARGFARRLLGGQVDWRPRAPSGDRREEQVRGRPVAGDRDVPEDGEARERASGGVAGSELDRIAERDHGVDVARGGEAGRGSGAHGARLQPLGGEADVLREQGPDPRRGQQPHGDELVPVSARPGDQVGPPGSLRRQGEGRPPGRRA
jgi:hypothetical protein